MGTTDKPAHGSDRAAGTRSAEVASLLDDADARDEKADVRDSDAEQRDGATDRQSFMDPDSDYDAVVRTRRSAAMDRTASKEDRVSAAEDRTNLASDHGSSREDD